ncbi:hypothetical protein [Bradyrhizobium sp. P5_C11_2]
MPLAEAAVAFASKGLQRHFRALRRKPWPALGADLVSAPNWSDFQAYVSQLLTEQRDRHEPYWQMQSDLVEKLRMGAVEASGVRVPAISLGEVEPIPPRFFDERPRIDWGRNTLKNYGLEFHRVRVRLQPAVPSSLLPPADSSMRSGRPSKEEAIERAIEHAIKEGFDLNGMPRKQAIEQIRISAEHLGLNTRLGFSVSVVQRVLFRRFGPRF